MRLRLPKKPAPAPLPRLEHGTPHVVGAPAAIGVRLLCLSLLDDAAAARERLANPDDADALHDFRVALRRLRSTIRAYEPLLEDSVGDKLRRLLRRVARSTGASRDLEVHIEWLSRVAAIPESSAGVAQELVRRLDVRKRVADAQMRQEIERDFDGLNRRLRTALSRYTGTIDRGRPLGDTTAEAAAARVAQLTAEMEGHLSAVKTSEDQAEAHEARIAAKRVRYVVEPFRKHIAGADELVDSLKDLQDVLGEMHDLDTLLAETDTRIENAAESCDSAWNEALAGLRDEIHRQRDLLYAKARSAWLEGNSEALFSLSRNIASAMREHASPPVEIERKFVLRGMPRLRGRNAEMQRIDQGYLPGTVVSERLRYVQDSSGKRYYRTIKSGEGLVRQELEEETTAQVFRQMWPLTKGRRIRKRRYKVNDGVLTWEIDRYDHISLIVAEVELPAADTPVVPPVWLARYLDREVTGEPEFLNANLAR